MARGRAHKRPSWPSSAVVELTSIAHANHAAAPCTPQSDNHMCLQRTGKLLVYYRRRVSLTRAKLVSGPSPPQSSGWAGFLMRQELCIWGFPKYLLITTDPAAPFSLEVLRCSPPSLPSQQTPLLAATQQSNFVCHEAE